MARDDSGKAKKQRWADWLNEKLQERRWNAADLVDASGDILIYGTVYNWTKATARAEAEICLVVAAALNTHPSAGSVEASEVLRAASYPLFADAMEGKELRLVGATAEPPDPGLIKILAAKGPTDDMKVAFIHWWQKRAAEDEARRTADAEVFFQRQTGPA